MSLWIGYQMQEDIIPRLRAWPGLVGCQIEADRTTDLPQEILPAVIVYAPSEGKTNSASAGTAAQFEGRLTIAFAVRHAGTDKAALRLQTAQYLQELQDCLFGDPTFLSAWSLLRWESANVELAFKTDGSLHDAFAQLTLVASYFDTYPTRISGPATLVDIVTATPAGEQIDHQQISFQGT